MAVAVDDPLGSIVGLAVGSAEGLTVVAVEGLGRTNGGTGDR